MTITNATIFSASYDEVETFLKTISDPKSRYKVNFIHASMPQLNGRNFAGYPFMVLRIRVNEDIKSFDNSTSEKNFRAIVTIYSDQPTDIEEVSDSIFAGFKSSTALTFGVRSLESSPINWTLDQKGKKVLFREVTLNLRSRI